MSPISRQTVGKRNRRPVAQRKWATVTNCSDVDWSVVGKTCKSVSGETPLDHRRHAITTWKGTNQSALCSNAALPDYIQDRSSSRRSVDSAALFSRLSDAPFSTHHRNLPISLLTPLPKWATHEKSRNWGRSKTCISLRRNYIKLTALTGILLKIYRWFSEILYGKMAAHGALGRQKPKMGENGLPFSIEHFWKAHITFE